MEEKEDVQVSMSLYDLNKSIIFNLPPQDKEVIYNQFMKIGHWCLDEPTPWFMLMCKERSDFTMFHVDIYKNYKSIGEAIWDVLAERGIISSIQYDSEQNTWEIWVKDEKEAYIFMLFEASWMIVEL